MNLQASSSRPHTSGTTVSFDRTLLVSFDVNKMPNRDPEHMMQELYLFKCSLLPGESLLFQESDTAVEDADFWHNCLELYPDLPPEKIDHKPSLPQFSICAESARLWLNVQYAQTERPVVAVKGDDITRAEQERWHQIILERSEELCDTESV